MDHWFLGLQTAKAAATQNVGGTSPLEIGTLFANGPLFIPLGPRGIRFNGAINYL